MEDGHDPAVEQTPQLSEVPDEQEHEQEQEWVPHREREENEREMEKEMSGRSCTAMRNPKWSRSPNHHDHDAVESGEEEKRYELTWEERRGREGRKEAERKRGEERRGDPSRKREERRGEGQEPRGRERRREGGGEEERKIEKERNGEEKNENLIYEGSDGHGPSKFPRNFLTGSSKFPRNSLVGG
ncbi:uncharacterized protein LOC130512928 [Raphanus sativus]|uniref:Uncharacterized protein LOC130512928 n=1 Tax=Raphanus sativus TaxID=3726 RepID=A0A9W3DUN6_RAPSA|nr:uncharacterized protein LOC130512928 [Raphanus sativus]